MKSKTSTTSKIFYVFREGISSSLNLLFLESVSVVLLGLCWLFVLFVSNAGLG